MFSMVGVVPVLGYHVDPATLVLSWLLLVLNQITLQILLQPHLKFTGPQPHVFHRHAPSSDLGSKTALACYTDVRLCHLVV